MLTENDNGAFLYRKERFQSPLEVHISEVTKSHPKGDDDIKFSIDSFHK